MLAQFQSESLSIGCIKTSKKKKIGIASVTAYPHEGCRVVVLFNVIQEQLVLFPSHAILFRFCE